MTADKRLKVWNKGGFYNEIHGNANGYVAGFGQCNKFCAGVYTGVNKVLHKALNVGLTVKIEKGGGGKDVLKKGSYKEL